MVMRSFGVQTVYHAAAYKHVPLVEHNPVEGIRNNSVGTRRMAEAALAAGVETFVLISTDKAVRPTNVMGASKRLAELVLQALARRGGGTRFCMVRFGNVLGSSGSVVPLFRKQIAAGGPVTLTHPEITRYFMTIPEAAQLVIQAGSMGQGGEVYVLDMGQPVKIIDLARRMIHLSGLEVRDEENPNGDIAIEVTGLRPGEKLYEELLIGDNVEGTSHPLIMRAYEHEVPWALLEERLARLDAACKDFDFEQVLALLGLLVQEYRPARHGDEALLWRTMTEPGKGDVVVH
jgi:FlaA1/EpsC-like NDP-sugar epimerase